MVSIGMYILEDGFDKRKGDITDYCVKAVLDGRSTYYIQVYRAKQPIVQDD
jgi:hypothetical protein